MEIHIFKIDGAFAIAPAEDRSAVLVDGLANIEAAGRWLSDREGALGPVVTPESGPRYRRGTLPARVLEGAQMLAAARVLVSAQVAQ